MKTILLFAFLLAFVSCNDGVQEQKSETKKETSSEKMLEATTYAKVKEGMKNNQATFLEFGSTHCKSCIEMDRLLYQIKEKNSKSNIFFIDIYSEKEATKTYKIRMIPTQVFLDKEGKEVYRHVGKLESKELNRLLKERGVIE